MDPARTIVAAVMLLGAAWLDLRSRRVPNLYWFPYLAMDVAFLAVDFSDAAWRHLLLASLVSVLAYLFYRFGYWGGADAKCVILLAFMVRENLHGATSVAILDTLVVGVTLVLLWPITLLISNGVQGRFAFPAMLLGWQTSLDKARNQRVWPLQDESGWRFRSRIGEDLHPIYRRLEEAGEQQVWVTPQLPSLVFIAVGFAIVTFVGSPLAWWPSFSRLLMLPF